MILFTGRSRVRTFLGRPRNRIFTKKANVMSVENMAQPPQDAGVEIEPIVFDFGQDLAAGELIMSVSSVTCTVKVGVDPSPSSRLSGGNMIVASPKTGAASGAVTTKFGGALGGVTYRLQCVVSTSAGQALSIVGYFGGQTPP